MSINQSNESTDLNIKCSSKCNFYFSTVQWSGGTAVPSLLQHTWWLSRHPSVPKPRSYCVRFDRYFLLKVTLCWKVPQVRGACFYEIFSFIYWFKTLTSFLLFCEVVYRQIQGEQWMRWVYYNVMRCSHVTF